MSFLLKKKSSLIYTLLSILLFFFIYYKAEIVFKGSRNDYYIFYYLFSASFFLFSLFTFRLKKIEIVNLIIISSLLSLYFVELSLFYIIDYTNKKKLEEKKKIYYEKTGKNFDTRETLEIYNDLKNQNIRLFIPPYKFIEDKLVPLSGISRSKTLFCNENGQYIFYKSDRYGFNNLDNNWDKKKISYFLIGDSFAQGACVEQSRNISGSLSKLVDKESGVINVGASGNGPLLSHAAMKEYSKKLNIKNLIWLFYDNDIQNLAEREIDNKLLLKYLIDDSFAQKLTEKQNKIDDKILKYIESNNSIIKKKNKSKFLYIYNFIKFKNIRSLIYTTFFERKYEKRNYVLFEKILKKTINYTKKNNMKLYFVYLPDYSKFSGYQKKNIVYKNVISITKANNVDIIDMLDEFKKKGNAINFFPFKQYGHYTNDGYKFIADIIYKKTN